VFQLQRKKFGRLPVSAHRGANAYAPENTMLAFEKAAALKADIIEFDVHLSKDGKCVVLHDEMLDRTTNGRGYVRDYTWDELKTLDAGSWFGLHYEAIRTRLGEYAAELPPPETLASCRIPRLEAVLEWSTAVKMPVSIEIKSPYPFYSGLNFYPGIVEKVLDLVATYGDEELTSLHSFDHRATLRCKELNPNIATMVSLGGAVMIDPAATARAAKANGIAIGSNWLTAEIVRQIQADDIAVFGWGLGEDPLNQRDDLRRLVVMGVDFVSGGAPDALRDVLRDLIENGNEDE
jgi:glycerophosphoryl diester phosphodiesterase